MCSAQRSRTTLASCVTSINRVLDEFAFLVDGGIIATFSLFSRRAQQGRTRMRKLVFGLALTLPIAVATHASAMPGVSHNPLMQDARVIGDLIEVKGGHRGPGGAAAVAGAAAMRSRHPAEIAAERWAGAAADVRPAFGGRAAAKLRTLPDRKSRGRSTGPVGHHTRRIVQAPGYALN